MRRNRSWLSVALRAAPLVLFLWMVRPMLASVALAGVFALILDPLRQRIARRFPRAAALAPLLLTIGSVVLVIIPLVFVALRVAASVQALFAGGADDLLERLQSFLARHFSGIAERLHLPIENIRQSAADAAQQVARAAAGFAGSVAASLPNQILEGFLFVVALYYFLRDGAALVRRMRRLSPFPPSDTDSLFDSIRQTVRGAILGQLATSAVQGALTTLAAFVFGVPGALVLGLIATVLSVLPLVGTAPVTVGAAIYLLASGRPGAAIGMGIAAALIAVSDNVVRPLVQRSSTQLHPLVLLISIFGGIQLLGLAGVFLGPVIAVTTFWTIDMVHAGRGAEAASGGPQE